MDLKFLILLIGYFPLLLAQGGFSIQTVYDFGKTYTGVTFQPYVKNWVAKPDGSFAQPWYNSYSLQEIKVMLMTIATKFRNITTYSMGVEIGNVNADWDKTDSNCLVAKAAAEMNKESNDLVITIAQGIYQKADPTVEEREIDNAFTAASWANGHFPGTVWALVFFNEAVNPSRGKQLLDILKRYGPPAKIQGLKIGPRFYNCQDIHGGPNREILLEITRQVDFIMCHGYPNELVTLGPTEAARKVISIFQAYVTLFKSANPNVEIILAETGWPSEGQGRNPEQETSIDNLRIYWLEIADLANRNSIRTYLFEAFDEPGKNAYDNENRNSHMGRFGSEGHYGWWRRRNNSDIYSNVEKVYEPPPPKIVPINETEIKNEKDGGTSAGLIVGVVIVVLLLIFLPVLIYLIKIIRRTKVILTKLSEQEIEEFEKGIPQTEIGEDGVQEVALFLPYDRNYEIPKEKLNIDKLRILGKGEYGIVYKGIIEIGGKEEDAAFKTIKASHSQSLQYLRGLLSELKLMIYIGKHENVIGLLGAYTAEIREGVAYIGAEFCSLGSLEKYLRANSKFGVQGVREKGHMYENTAEREPEISPYLLIKWSREIASGMAWLSSKNVIHADLATRNVLLNADKTAKITDFGLSRRLYEYTNYVKESQEPLPWRWMAVESLKAMNFSTKSDVWAYGVTLWEIFTLGDIPFPGRSWQVSFVQDLEDGLRLPCPKYADEKIYEEMVKCWNRNPEQRPQFSELDNFFQRFL